MILRVYATDWCPHCIKTIAFLKNNNIPFETINMEKKMPIEMLKKVIDVNGGHDWVVPTLEFNGQWRKGQFFNEEKLKQDLITMGVITHL